MIQHLLEQFCMHIPLFLGASLSFSLMKVPDLSIETAYVVGAFSSSWLYLYLVDYPWYVQLLACLCISLVGGFSVGFLSSLLTQLLRISHLLATILTTGIFYSINQLLFGPYFSLHIGSKASLFSIKYFFLIQFCFLVVAYVFFLRSRFGYLLAAYGINKSFFSVYHIDMQKLFIYGICCANMLAGYGGYLQAQYNGFVEISMGAGKALVCITALIIGQMCIKSLHPISIIKPFLGGIFYFMLHSFLIKMGFGSMYFSMVQAIIVIIMIMLERSIKKDSFGELGI